MTAAMTGLVGLTQLAESHAAAYRIALPQELAGGVSNINGDQNINITHDRRPASM